MNKKKEYKSALRNQLTAIKGMSKEDFPESGIITFKYNLSSGEAVSYIEDEKEGVQAFAKDVTGSSGRPFP